LTRMFAHLECPDMRTAYREIGAQACPRGLPARDSDDEGAREVNIYRVRAGSSPEGEHARAPK